MVAKLGIPRGVIKRSSANRYTFFNDSKLIHCRIVGKVRHLPAVGPCDLAPTRRRLGSSISPRRCRRTSLCALAVAGRISRLTSRITTTSMLPWRHTLHVLYASSHHVSLDPNHPSLTRCHFLQESADQDVLATLDNARLRKAFSPVASRLLLVCSNESFGRHGFRGTVFRADPPPNTDSSAVANASAGQGRGRHRSAVRYGGA